GDGPGTDRRGGGAAVGRAVGAGAHIRVLRAEADPRCRPPLRAAPGGAGGGHRRPAGSSFPGAGGSGNQRQGGGGGRIQVWPQPVEGPDPAAEAADQSRLAEPAEVVADGRLTQLEGRGEVADA